MHCVDEMSQSNVTNLLAGLEGVCSVFLVEHALHFHYKLKSYSLIFPAAQLCPSELINGICHHAKPLCLMTFSKTPQLPTLTHLQPYTTHAHSLHTPLYPQWSRGTSTQAGRQTVSQTHTYVYNVLYKAYFFLLILILQAQQTNTAKSLFVFMCWLLCLRMF